MEGMKESSPAALTLSPAPRPRRVRRVSWRIWLAWIAAFVSLTLLVAAGLLVVAAVRDRPPPHIVLDARFTSTGLAPGSRPTRAEVVTDPVLRRARVTLADAPTVSGADGGSRTLYYLDLTAAGGTVVVRDGPGAPWRRGSLKPARQPSLLTREGVRALFASLLRRAVPGTTESVGIGNRPVTTFVTAGVTWPFPSTGPVRVWLDDVTGLPLRFRVGTAPGPRASGSPAAVGGYVTVVDSLRPRLSTSLPSDFFAPPDQRPSPWQSLADGLARWLHK